MSFYGKIYAQMDNVFHLFHFENSENDTDFAGKLSSDFTLDAESFNDKVIMKAGNSWIQFVQIPNPLEGEIGDAVEIFHGPPMIGEEHAGKAKNIILDIQPGAQYESLISDSSSLLKQEEKDILKGYRSEGRLLFFGDTITVASPTYDKAGHITGYQNISYVLSEVPRLEEFLNMTNDIDELQEIVGVEGYPDNCSQASLGYRVKELETFEERFEEVEESVKEIQDSVENAENSAKNAENSAKNAENYASRTYGSLSDIETKYVALINAIGASNNTPIIAQKPSMETPNILNWLIELDQRITALGG